MSDNTEETGISLAEFKAWLSGVEEMQDADWAPSLTQWKRIRAKFFEIQPEVAQVAQRRPLPQGPMAQAPVQGFQPTQYQPYQQERPSMPQPLPPGLNTGMEGRAKTPDIDSSNGYQSSLV